jgi:hypothetical protein
VTVARLREDVEREFGKWVRVRRGLDDEDVVDLRRRARETAAVILDERRGPRSGLRGSSRP